MELEEVEIICNENVLDQYAAERQNFKWSCRSVFDQEPSSDGSHGGLLSIFSYSTVNYIMSFFRRDVKTCCVCFEPITRKENLFRNACEHYTCRECAETFYRGQVRDGKTVFTCIAPDCNLEVDREALLSLLDDKSRLQLRRSVVRQKMLSLPESIRVPCSKPGCSGILLKLNAQDFFKTCAVCELNGRQTHYCFKCSKFHSKEEHYTLGNQAKSFLRQMWPFQATTSAQKAEKLAKKAGLQTKKCPHCMTPVAKDDNCNHVTCHECGQEFNWQYEREWKGYGDEAARGAVWGRGARQQEQRLEQLHQQIAVQMQQEAEILPQQTQQPRRRRTLW